MAILLTDPLPLPMRNLVERVTEVYDIAVAVEAHAAAAVLASLAGSILDGSVLELSRVTAAHSRRQMEEQK